MLGAFLDLRFSLRSLAKTPGFAAVAILTLALARAAQRRREVAVRSSLGARPWRLVRLLLAETVVLGVAGGALGLAFAAWGVDALVQASPTDLPRSEEIGLHRAGFLFACGLTLLTGVLSGLVPALHLVRRNLGHLLGAAGRGNAGERSGSRTRALLTVTEVAVALVLLVGAGLLVRSLLQLTAVDPGFRPDRVLALQLFVYGEKYPSGEEQQRFVERLQGELAALPGVEAVGLTDQLPLSELRGGLTPLRVDGRPEPEGQMSRPLVADPGYFPTMGIGLLAGRSFGAEDRAGAPAVAILNEAAARLYFPGESPIGRRILLGEAAQGREPAPWTVVGVAENVREDSFESLPQPAVYLPFAQNVTGTLSVVLRSSVPPATLLEAAQRRVWQVDPMQPIYRAFPLDSLVDRSTAQRRFYTSLLGLFALLAWVLAAVGVYGVVSYGVSQRVREIGIRMSVGARATDVLRLVLRGGALLVGAGVAVGLLGSLLLVRTLSSFLFGIAAIDPVTFLAVPALLVLVALLACWLPARRAARLDPVEVLRLS